MTGRQLIDKYGGHFKTYRAYFNREMSAEEQEVFEQSVACNFLQQKLIEEEQAKSAVKCDHEGY